MAAGRSDSCSLALVVLGVLFQLLLFKCYQSMGNNLNPARRLTENFHASTWRLFKPASCIAKDVKFCKQTTRKFNNFNIMVILLVFSYYAVIFQATLALTDEMKLNMELSILVSN